MSKFRFEVREHKPIWMHFIAPLIAVFFALFIATWLIVLAGANPYDSYLSIFNGKTNDYNK